jgi:propanol-preferring alcohol dehydrogenase
MKTRAMRLSAPGAALVPEELTVADPGPCEVVIEVAACGVCRTDLHTVDGEIAAPRLPLTPGHEIVGRVVRRGSDATRFAPGERVGVPWLGWTCGRCEACLSGRENLCASARFTGLDRDGGYAGHAVADERFCFAIPDGFDDEHAAPLLCAGLIGYRAYAMVPDARRIGIYGFGAAAHLVAQVALFEGREVYAFTRPGDARAREFALGLGCSWAGGSDALPPHALDAALIFAPAGALVPAALAATAPGGTVVCAGIHMSDIPSFPYSLLWKERVLRSVANLTRRDGEAFLDLAARAGVRTTVHPYPLGRANEALDDLRHGRFEGAAVLIPDHDPRRAP